jgi:hypothetical protein
MPLQRKFRLPPPADHDPAIRDKVIVPDLQVPKPEEFEGYIKEKDIADFTKQTRKILIAMSISDQWSDWQTQAIIDLWTYVQKLDAERSRDKIELARLKAQEDHRDKIKGKGKWIGMTFGAGLIAASAKALIEWLAK